MIYVPIMPRQPERYTFLAGSRSLNFHRIALNYLEHHDLSRDYARSLTRVGDSYDKYLISIGLDASDSSLHIAAWLKSLPLQSATKINYRRMALTLIRWGNLHGMHYYRTDDIPSVKPVRKPTIAWTQDDIGVLYKTALNQKGHFSSSCAKNLFWPAFILIGYETGIRFGDILALTSCQVRGKRLFITHSKTGVASAKIVSKQCKSFVDRLVAASPDDRVMGWALSRKYVTRYFKRLVAEAGLKGTSKYLRRSGATHCEQQQSGSATRFLGHISGQALAQRHYIDWTQLSEAVPRPPELRLN